MDISSEEWKKMFEVAGGLSLILPERSEWECELFGCGKEIVLNFEKGNVLNRFWRLMQYLLLRNK